MDSDQERNVERIAIVTGGNRGIGYQICHDLAVQGLRVLLTARRVASGEEAAARLQEAGLPVTFHQLDVTDPASVRRLTKTVADQYGRADVLVNNAGVKLDDGVSPLELDLGVLRQTMEVNVYGPLRLSQALIPLMQRHSYGRIVNVSSQAGRLSNPQPDGLAYRTSKAALNMVTRVLAKRLEGSNILVNAVHPGWVQTDMGGLFAPRTLAESTDTIIWLATLPDSGPTGGFFYDRQPMEW
jgi:NAD(P)-dependent dehydrogenase (short-subunit alcohol dehydrogenase family)